MAQSVAQSESESISENLKWTYKSRATEGKFWAAKGRYFGYESQDDDFRENQDSRLVRFIFQRFLEGGTMSAIAKELNEKSSRTTMGKEWTFTSVRQILKNEVYVGNVIFHKKPSRDVITGEVDKDWEPKYVKDHHKGLVTREVWDRAQYLLKNPDKRGKKVLDSKVSMEEKMEQVLEQVPGLIRSGVNRPRLLAEKMDVPVTTVQYYLCKLQEAGKVRNEGRYWCVAGEENNGECG